MTRPVSSAFRSLLSARTPGDGVVLLLRLTHDDFADQDWTDCEEDVTSGSTTYSSRHFTIPLPSDEDGMVEVPLEVDVRDMDDDDLDDILGAADDRPDVEVDVVSRSDPDTVEATFVFQMRSASADLGVLRATLMYEPLLATPYPGVIFDAERFPDLFE